MISVIDELQEFIFREESHRLLLDFAVFENKKSRDRRDLILHCDLGLIVNVYFTDDELAFVFI